MSAQRATMLRVASSRMSAAEAWLRMRGPCKCCMTNCAKQCATRLSREDPLVPKGKPVMVSTVPSLECEWLKSDDRIFEDFQKLVVSAASVRLMIFHAATTERCRSLFGEMHCQVRLFRPTMKLGSYILCGLVYVKPFFRIATI